MKCTAGAAFNIGAKPNLYCEAIELVCGGSPKVCVLVEWKALDTFIKPPLLQESRLTGGGSPQLVGLVEWKVPVEWEMGAANSFH